jgi:hypothetical protein
MSNPSLYNQPRPFESTTSGINDGGTTPPPTGMTANQKAGLSMATGVISALAAYSVSKSSQKMMEAETKMNLISERKAARDQSKLRREQLDRALSERVLSNAMSGLKMEGTAMSGAARDNQQYTTDELTANENLKSSAAAQKRDLWAKKLQSKMAARKGLWDAGQAGMEGFANAGAAN